MAHAAKSSRATPAREEQVRALVERLTEGGRAANHLSKAASALEVAAVAERLARQEVMAARELDGATWEQVGAALGVSRQSAHERFRTGPDGMHTRLFKRKLAQGSESGSSTLGSTSPTTSATRRTAASANE